EPRLQVKALHKNVIEALVITGCARGCIRTIIDHGRDWLERRISMSQYFRVSSASSLVILAQKGNTKKKKKQ
ncbi:ATP-dependent DNA helicase RRM3-like, partial [Aphis craccivora]